jgi:hypothetical protein
MAMTRTKLVRTKLVMSMTPAAGIVVDTVVTEPVK